MLHRRQLPGVGIEDLAEHLHQSGTDATTVPGQMFLGISEHNQFQKHFGLYLNTKMSLMLLLVVSLKIL